MPPSAAPGVAAGGVQLGHDADVGAVPRCLDGGAHPGEACAHHHHVVSNHQRLRSTQRWSPMQPTKRLTGRAGTSVALLVTADLRSILDQERGRGRMAATDRDHLTREERLAKMAFALPAARRVLREPVAARSCSSRTHADAHRPDAPTTARRTSRRQVLARSKAQHVHRRRRPRQRAAPGDRPRRVGARLGAPGRLHRRAGDDRRRRLHRQRPRPARAGPPLHRGLERQHRRHAGRPVLPRRRDADGFEPELRRHLHAQPGRGRTTPTTA